MARPCEACASLRCTSCDFDVISFEHAAWDERGGVLTLCLPIVYLGFRV